MVFLMYMLSCMVILGAVVGSFLNVCIYRLPWEKSIIWPGSHCPKCLWPVRAYDNIPIVSWFVLRGRCRDCGAAISPRYMLLETFTAATFGGVFWLECVIAGLPFSFYAYHIILVAALIVATFIDFDLQIIPDSVTITGTLIGLVGGTVISGVHFIPIIDPAPDPGLLLGATRLSYGLIVAIAWAMWGLALFWLLRGAEAHMGAAEIILMIGTFVYLAFHTAVLIVSLLKVAPSFPGWSRWFLGHPHWQGFGTSLIGMLVGAGLIWVVRVLGTAVFRKEAMGFGDVTLLGMVGAFLGWQPVVVVFFLAPFCALAIGLVQWVFLGNNVLPYGPYLSIAAVVVLLFWVRIWPLVMLHFALLDMVPVAPAVIILTPIMLFCLYRNGRLPQRSGSAQGQNP